MATTTITPQNIVETGLEATTEAGALAMQFANTGLQFVWVINGATDATLTFDSQTNCERGSDHNVAAVCSANEERIIGPFPTGRWNDASGNVLIAIDDVTNVTIAVLTLPMAS